MDELVANGPALFQMLLAAVKDDVAEFNQEFPEATSMLHVQQIGDTSFRVVRQYSPEFILTATISKDQRIINWEIIRGGIKYSDVFGMEHNSAGGILTYNGVITPFPEASRKLILPAIQDTV